MISRGSVKKIYTFLIVSLPISSMYSSGIPGFSLGEILLIILVLCSFNTIKNDIIFSTKNWILNLIYFTILVSLSSIFIFSYNALSILVRTIRFVFYLVLIFLYSKKYFDLKLATRTFKIISLCGFLYLVLQTVLYNYFGYHLKGFLPFVPLYTPDYAVFDYELIYQTVFFRPTSFFLEPAHYAQFSLIGLNIMLFYYDNNIKNLLIAVLITTGIVLSTSGLGIIFAFLLWIFLIVNNLTTRKLGLKYKIIGLLIFVVGIVMLPIMFRTELVRNTLSRITNLSNTGAISARFQGFVAYFTEDNLFFKIFGHGYGNTPFGVWFSGYAHILYSLGLVGFVYINIKLMKIYFKTKVILQKYQVILIVFLSITSETFNNFWILPLLSLVLCEIDYRIIIDKMKGELT